MTDAVVTCPMRLWDDWLAEGDLAGQPDSGIEWVFWLGDRKPSIRPGERVYVVAHGKLRGYAPLVRLEQARIPGLHPGYRYGLIRAGGAVAVTLLSQEAYATMSPRAARESGRAEPIRGFRGWRYRWWERSAEVPFAEWKQP